MRYWVKNLTLTAIALVVFIAVIVYNNQYEWLNGSIGLPNYEMAYADTAVTLVYTDITSNRQLTQSVILKKGKNSVLFSMLVPDNQNDFTLTYHLKENSDNNVMRLAYLDEGSINNKREIVAGNLTEPLKLQAVRGRVIRINLLENIPAWEKANTTVEQLFNLSKSDYENTERFIAFVRTQNYENPQLELRWLLCRADIESELFWAYRNQDAPGQLMNTLFLEGIYYYVDLNDPNGLIFDRTTLHDQFAKLVFEQGVDR
mgnify:CR=1 FL=1